MDYLTGSHEAERTSIGSRADLRASVSPVPSTFRCIRAGSAGVHRFAALTSHGTRERIINRPQCSGELRTVASRRYGTIRTSCVRFRSFRRVGRGFTGSAPSAETRTHQRNTEVGNDEVRLADRYAEHLKTGRDGARRGPSRTPDELAVPRRLVVYNRRLNPDRWTEAATMDGKVSSAVDYRTTEKL